MSLSIEESSFAAFKCYICFYSRLEFLNVQVFNVHLKNYKVTRIKTNVVEALVQDVLWKNVLDYTILSPDAYKKIVLNFITSLTDVKVASLDLVIT